MDQHTITENKWAGFETCSGITTGGNRAWQSTPRAPQKGALHADGNFFYFV